ncbi:MAG: LptF/LptG family permease, partial [Phycisphaerae bacterium]|nr:LptF/LptG family permease [Phycisphaerae bacterium]
TWLVSISLRGPAQLYSPFVDDEPSRRGGWKIDRCIMPPDIVRNAEKINLTDLYDRAEAVTANEHILNQIKHLKQSRVPKLIGGVTAEIHSRPAYCLSCFLLVAMGAALGLIFRGGQMISAFALSVIPAAVVIVMVLMGKEMVSNPDSPRAVGLMAIWGGNLMLLIADSLVYLYLMRK